MKFDIQKIVEAYCKLDGTIYETLHRDCHVFCVQQHTYPCCVCVCICLRVHEAIMLCIHKQAGEQN